MRSSNLSWTKLRTSTLGTKRTPGRPCLPSSQTSTHTSSLMTVMPRPLRTNSSTLWFIRSSSRYSRRRLKVGFQWFKYTDLIQSCDISVEKFFELIQKVNHTVILTPFREAKKVTKPKCSFRYYSRLASTLISFR